MDPNPELVASFGEELRRRRTAANLTAPELARLLTLRLGRHVKHQSVYAWEQGKYGPGDWETARAIDAELGAEGQLSRMLVAPAVDQRLTELEDQVTELFRLVQRLQKRRAAG